VTAATTTSGAGSRNPGNVVPTPVPAKGIAWEVFRWWLVALAAACIAGWFISPEKPNSGFVSAAAVLTVVSTAAVGIERVVEGFFAIIGASSKFGGWWPLKQVSGAITSFEANTNTYLAKPLSDALEALEAAKDAAVEAHKLTDEAKKTVEQEIDAYKRTRDQLQGRLDNLKNLAPGSARFDGAGEVAKSATTTMDAIAKRTAALSGEISSGVIGAADTLAGACNQASDVVASFSDNPARKLISLMMGTILGIAVASLMGLNLFLAVLDEPAPANAANATADGTVGATAAAGSAAATPAERQWRGC